MLSLTLLTLSLTARAFRMPVGAPCNITNSHLDANTKAFVSDCDFWSFCSANGTCLPRGCRRDQYVLSSLLDDGKPLPPMCDEDHFCPDDASACLPLVDLGGRCQLNRDDECRSPDPSIRYAVHNEWDTFTGKGSVCLLGICMWTNVSLGQSCTHESTTYIGYDVDGHSVANEVIRDNCIEGEGYCHLDNSTCVGLKEIEESCEHDRECKTFNCGDDNKCLIPAEATLRIRPWAYALIGMSLTAAMGGVLVVLVMLHNRMQAEKRVALETYRTEQLAYRQSILSFHSTLALEKSETSIADIAKAPADDAVLHDQHQGLDKWDRADSGSLRERK